MKKILYAVLTISFIFILIPSVVEAISKFFPVTPWNSDKDNTVYEIIVVYKELDHSASTKQWNTIISTVNYFTNNGLSNNNEFIYMGRTFKLSKIYENEHWPIICSGKDPNNKLKNVVAILGPITSSCAVEMIENYEVEIPVISSFATLPSLNHKARKFFHRTVPDDNLRVDKLIQLWEQDATRNPTDRDLIIYDSKNIYSSDSYAKVSNNIEKLHTVDFIDAAHARTNSYEASARYESIFVMANQAEPSISSAIKQVKKDQYANHQEHRPKFFAKTEYADSLLLDSPGSIVAMTPTLLSYNRQDENTFLDVERKNLNQRSASSFLAFEALYKAIGQVSRFGTKCKSESKVDVLRCEIIQHLKTSYRSQLIGNKIEFNGTTGDIDMTFLVKAEIRTLGTQFKYAPPTQNLPSLVSIFYNNGYRGVWLGDPVEINIETTKNSPFLINFKYVSPDWIPHGMFKQSIEDLFSFDHTFELNEKQYAFHPYFIGVYRVEVAGLGPDLRQSAGKHEIDIVPPRGLFVMVLLALVIAILVSFITPPVNQRINRSRLVLEVVGAALFLYFMTVTLRGFNLPGAPTLSFSSEPVTNLVYCAIIAGTVRMKIFAYFINPIIERFIPSDNKIAEQNRRHS